MTLAELKEMEREKALAEAKASTAMFLLPSQVAKITGADPQTIRYTARQRPELLGYPFTFSGSHMKIPRVPFLRFLGEL